MTELIELIHAARAADDPRVRVDAFAEIVRRFQDMAVAVAFARLGDFQLAEDVAQAAFVEAWQKLDLLRDSRAFPSWLKRIVLSRCGRLTRRKRVETTSLESAENVADGFPTAQAHMEDEETRRFVAAAVAALPIGQREAISLYYIAGRSHAEIAEALGVPVGTVKSRLHAARASMKKGLMTMARDGLRGQAPSRDEAFVASVTFIEAIKAGDTARVAEALEQRPELATTAYPKETRPIHRRRPIHYATQAGFSEIVRLLVDHGGDPLDGWHWNVYVPSALGMAEARDDAASVRLMNAAFWNRLDANDQAIHATDAHGNTPLHLAVYHGKPVWISDLIERGADIDAVNERGYRPIHMALAHVYDDDNARNAERDRASASVLIERGATVDLWVACALGDDNAVSRLIETESADVNAHNGLQQGPRGFGFPLGVAAFHGHADICRTLLEQGANPDAPCRWPDEDETGAPLLFAIQREHWDVAHTLLDHGASVNSPHIDAGWSVQDAGYRCANADLRERLALKGSRPTLPAYLEAKDYVVINEILHRTPSELLDVLAGAIYWGDLRLVEACLNRKPSLSNEDANRLFRGVAYTWRADTDTLAETLKLLIADGCDPNVVDAESGETPLIHFAHLHVPNHRSEDDMLRLIPALLDGGATINAQHRDNGATALAFAAKSGAAQLVELLLERGADPSLPTDRPENRPAAWAEAEGHLHIADRLAALS